MRHHYLRSKSSIFPFLTKASRTDGRTDRPSYRDARTHLKIVGSLGTGFEDKRPGKSSQSASTFFVAATDHHDEGPVTQHVTQDGAAIPRSSSLFLLSLNVLYIHIQPALSFISSSPSLLSITSTLSFTLLNIIIPLALYPIRPSVPFLTED